MIPTLTTLFPYTTLFRSEVARDQQDDIIEISIVVEAGDPRLIRRCGVGDRRECQDGGDKRKTNKPPQYDLRTYRCHCHPVAERSEEHTSELQSLTNLVCR